MSRVSIYDTTLRDGSQGEGVNFSLQDKLLLTKRLDEIGVDYIEGGYPLSNPKDAEYFQAVRELSLSHAKVCAFGMTRRKNAPAETDTCLKALIAAETPVVTIVGLQIGTLLAGAVLTETIFSWPGVGKWLIESIGRRDYPALQGGIMLISSIVIVVNLIVDLTYGLINPRIRHAR